MAVYTLELQNNAFYVGYSDDFPRRIAQHFLGRGAMWTRLHPPVRVLEVTPGNKELETAQTIALMVQKGWQRVRGAAWTSTELTSMPLPLSRALATRPPRELPVGKGKAAYEYLGHAVCLREEANAFVARITGPIALRSCPGNGVKTFVATTEGAAREAAETWLLGAGEGDSGECESFGAWGGIAVD